MVRVRRCAGTSVHNDREAGRGPAPLRPDPRPGGNGVVDLAGDEDRHGDDTGLKATRKSIFVFDRVPQCRIGKPLDSVKARRLDLKQNDEQVKPRKRPTMEVNAASDHDIFASDARRTDSESASSQSLTNLPTVTPHTPGLPTERKVRTRARRILARLRGCVAE